MMWQDLIFMTGSTLSIVFLAPTLRDASARVPLGTSLPSMGIGVVYGVTFATLGMTLSSLGALAAGGMWALIALRRSPGADSSATMSRREAVRLFARDARRWGSKRITGGPAVVECFSTDFETFPGNSAAIATEYGIPSAQGRSREHGQSAD